MSCKEKTVTTRYPVLYDYSLMTGTCMHAKRSRHSSLSGDIITVPPYLLISFTTSEEMGRALRMVRRNAPDGVVYVLSHLSIPPTTRGKRAKPLKSLVEAFADTGLAYEVVASKDLAVIGPLPQEYLRFRSL